MKVTLTYSDEECKSFDVFNDEGVMIESTKNLLILISLMT